MDRLKPMPDREKFTHALGMVRLYQKQVLPFVEQRLGYEAMHELESVWQAGIAHTRESYPDKENYQRAYNNWLWIALCSHDFMADQLDREGVGDYKRLLLKAYKRQHDQPDLLLYHMLKRQSSLIRAWAYEMQWMTPIEITDQEADQAICVVPQCRILQTPGTERVCKVDCWNVGTEIAYQVYHIKRKTRLVDHCCTITITAPED